MEKNISPKKILKLFILIAFMLSGLTALAYEVIWARQLIVLTGATIYAATALLSAFLLGYGIGSVIMGHIIHKIHRILFFSFMQIGAGLFGFLTPYLIYSLTNTRIVSLFALKIGLSFFMIMLPASFFGATWPLANSLYLKEKNIAQGSGKLYSVNALGGTFGALLAGFWLIPYLGLKNASFTVALLNISIGIMLLILARWKEK